ncbi:MAG TPA: MnhB domain-containing protein [Planctomycetota bacterium]|nr:MnhB domain-containing protein [Planctomycetota bacterium]
MSQLVKDTARLLAGLVLTFGIYAMVHGGQRPAGAVAGGAVVAGAFVMLVLACGRTEGLFVPEALAGRWQALAVLGLALIGLAGLANSGTLFADQAFAGRWPAGSLLARGSGLVVDLTIGAAVWMGLIRAFLALAAFRGDADGGREQP